MSLVNNLNQEAIAKTKAAMESNPNAGKKVSKLAGQWKSSEGTFTSEIKFAKGSSTVVMSPALEVGGRLDNALKYPLLKDICLFGFTGCITWAFIGDLARNGCSIRNGRTSSVAHVDLGPTLREEGDGTMGISALDVSFAVELDEQTPEKQQVTLDALQRTWNECPAAYFAGRANPVAIEVIVERAAEAQPADTSPTGLVNGINMNTRERASKRDQSATSTSWDAQCPWLADGSEHLMEMHVPECYETLRMDVLPGGGGRGSNPNPVQWCMAGVMGTLAADVAAAAAKRSMLIDTIDVECTADQNMRPVFLGELAPIFQNISIQVRIRPAAGSQVDAKTLSDLVHQVAKSSTGVEAWTKSVPINASVCWKKSIRLGEEKK